MFRFTFAATILSLLGGLSPAQFMARHWQKKPLLVRQAVTTPPALLSRAELFELADRDGVESRLVVRDGANWRLRQGPFTRRALPALKRPGWTLLVQGWTCMWTPRMRCCSGSVLHRMPGSMM